MYDHNHRHPQHTRYGCAPCTSVPVSAERLYEPVPEVRAGGLYHGAPCTAGTKVQLHRNLCVPSVPKVQLHRNLRVPSVCVKSRMIVAFRRKMTPNFTQPTKNCCYNDIFK